MFDGSVGVRQPDFVDIVQNILARLMVVFAVTLQDFVTAGRVFKRHERYIRAVFCADEEDERFFADKTLVVVHSSHAMVQRFSFTDKVSRTSCDDADKRAPFCVLQGQVFLRNGGELRVQFFALFRVFHSLFRGVLVYAYVVPAFEVVRETVLLFGHIQAEILAGFEVVEIGVRIGALFRDIIKEPFEFFPFEQLFQRFERAVVDQPKFCFLVVLKLFERLFCLIRSDDDIYVVVPVLKRRFVCDKPLAEGFVRSAAFEYRLAQRDPRKAELHQHFELRILSVEP